MSAEFIVTLYIIVAFCARKNLSFIFFHSISKINGNYSAEKISHQITKAQKMHKSNLISYERKISETLCFGAFVAKIMNV